MIFALCLAIASLQAPKTDLIVLAAASLTAPLTEIARDFEGEYNSVRLQISYAGSQQLAAQINLGAPADVFLSADLSQMDVVVQSMMVDEGQVRPFVANELALIVSRSAAPRIKGLADLGKKNVKISMAGNSVPVGAYTREMLHLASAKLGAPWLARVEENVVSQETNVSAVLSRVEMDEVDAGFVYTSDALRVKKATTRVLPKEWNVRAVYYLAVPKGSENPESARMFADYVLGRKGQALLAKYGFRPLK